MFFKHTYTVNEGPRNKHCQQSFTESHYVQMTVYIKQEKYSKLTSMTSKPLNE